MWFLASQLDELVQLVLKAVAAGILSGAFFSALFRIKAPKGD